MILGPVKNRKNGPLYIPPSSLLMPISVARSMLAPAKPCFPAVFANWRVSIGRRHGCKGMLSCPSQPMPRLSQVLRSTNISSVPSQGSEKPGGRTQEQVRCYIPQARCMAEPKEIGGTQGQECSMRVKHTGALRMDAAQPLTSSIFFSSHDGCATSTV